jgi:hypothetical protein
MTTEPVPPVKRSRWRRALVAVAALLAVGLLAAWWLNGSVDREMAAIFADLDAREPGWQLADIEAARKQVPDAENSALHIQAILKLGRLYLTHAADYEDHFGDAIPAERMLNDGQIRLLHREFALRAKVREESRKLNDMPNGRFPIRYGDHFLNTMLDSQRLREVLHLLHHDVMLLAQEGKSEEAMASCRAQLNTARAVGDEPLLLSMLLRFTGQAYTLESLERVLGQGEVSEASLGGMQLALADEAGQSLLVNAMRGERAGQRLIYEAMKSGKLKPTEIAGKSASKKFDKLLDDWFPMRVMRHYPEFFRAQSEWMAIVELPSPERLAKARELAAASKDWTNPLQRDFMPAIDNMARAESRLQALLRCAIVGVACERYRLQHKDWPTSLDALVQAKLLDAVPLDPFDGRPLRFLRTKAGVLVYSVGLDGVDNGGNDHRENIAAPGVDLGFRLWDVPSRRQPPLPPRPKPKEDE